MQTSSNRMGQGPVSKPRAEESPNETTLSFPGPALVHFWCILMQQNHLVLSFLVFWSFFTQNSIQIGHLLSITLRIHSFPRFQQLVVDYALLIPPNTQHCISPFLNHLNHSKHCVLPRECSPNVCRSIRCDSAAVFFK